MKKKYNLWSLNIPINFKKLDKEIINYLNVCEKNLGLIPNILLTNSIDKKRFETFNIFYNRLMQDKNFLNKIEKEMIAVVVSSINRCLYCCVSHSYNLGKLLKDPILSKKILINYKTANLTSKHQAMLDFSSKLTRNSYLIDDNDRNLLRRKKYSEKHILEIIEITSFFNMTNRIASGTNMVPNKEYFSF